ncbi:MAG: hypothetical protein M3N43_10615, partial [Actinomycetota bacterium]|nr:hypothetical protein [Actinomycetota bacterium]
QRLAEGGAAARDVAHLAAEGLGGMVTAAGEADTWSREISGAAEEVRSLVAGMSAALATVRGAAESTSAAAEQIAASTQELSGSTSDVAGTAHQLEAAAVGLAEAVAGFQMTAEVPVPADLAEATPRRPARRRGERKIALAS